MYSLRIVLSVNLIFLSVISSSSSFTILNIPLEHGKKSNPEIASRIIFGEPVNITDYPYYAFLGNCGGAILSNRWIVTAAHCVVKPDNEDGPWIVYVGSEGDEGSRKYEYNKILIHPKYDSEDGLNDIALLKLAKKIKFSPKVQPIKLPEEEFKEGWMVVVGRGDDETNGLSKYLKKTELFAFNSGWNCDYITNDKSVFCTHRRGFYPSICFGDSGSPLVKENRLIGIASSIERSNCSINKFASFTNVVTFVPWIKEVMKK